MTDLLNKALLSRAVGLGITRTDAIGARAITEIILPCGISRETALNIGHSVVDMLKKKNLSVDFDLRQIDDAKKGMDQVGSLSFYQELPKDGRTEDAQKELERQVSEATGVTIHHFEKDTPYDTVHEAIRRPVMDAQESCHLSSLPASNRLAQHDNTPSRG